MPVNAVNNPTLMDVAGYLPKLSGQAIMIEALNFASEFWDDITFIQANNGTHHDASIRTGLPSGTWRALYEGIDPSRSNYVNVSDKSGQLADYSVIDKALYDRMGSNAATWRAQEDAAFYEGMMQNVLKTVFYGDINDSARAFVGLANRFNTVNTATSKTAENVIDAGGTGATNASIWLVGWSPRTVALFYPEGTKAGLQIQNLGQQTRQSSNGKSYEALVTYFEINVGLSVQDWTSVVRIANIDVTTLKADLSSGPDLPALMDRATDMLKNSGGMRPVWYTTRTVRGFIRSQVEKKTGFTLHSEDLYNRDRKVATYAGYPIRALETLLNTEVRVV